MNQTNLLIAIFGGIVLFVVVLVIFVRRWARAKTAEWVQAASGLGLAPSGTFPRSHTMSGSLDGIAVGIAHRSKTTRSVGAKSHTTTTIWCEAFATIPGGTGDLVVAEEGVFAALGKLVGGTDHKTGDDAFDRKFLVKGSPQSAAYLTPSARAALIALENNLRGEVTVTDGAVRWKGNSTNAQGAGNIVRALGATAKAFKS